MQTVAALHQFAIVRRQAEVAAEQKPYGGYLPSIPLAVVGIVLYGAVAAIFVTHLLRQGSRWMLVLTLGTCFMTLGFIMKIPVHNNGTSLGLYIIETLFILLSPCAFLANNYMSLGRLALYLGPEISSCLPVRATRLAKYFVWSDVITFWVQAGGGGLSASGNRDTAKIGTYIALTGIILQAVSFGMYFIILIVWGMRVRKRFPEVWYISSGSNRHFQAPHPSLLKFWDRTPVLNWTILWRALIFSGICFFIRSVYRVAEFAGGYDSYLYTTEWPILSFDALPLWIGLLSFVFFWPPRFMKHNDLLESNSQGTELGDAKRASPAV